MANSGGLSCPDGVARMGYYSISGLPTLVWNGTLKWSGAGTDAADGVQYRATILGLLPEPSAFKLTINSVSLTPPSGSIDLDIEVMEDGIDVSSMVLRMALIQDNVPYGGDTFDDVTIDMLDEVAVTVSDLGQVQNVFQLFDINPFFLEQNLELVAFLQDNNGKKIHAAASSKSVPAPPYSMRYYALGDRTRVGPSSDFQYFDFFRVYNTGTMTDTYHVDMSGYYPPGWSTGICDEATCYGPTFSTELAPGEYVELHVMVLPFMPGYASLTVEISQENLVQDFPRSLQYNYITNDVDVLVVDDDGAANYEAYFADALADRGYTYGIWDRMAVGPTASALANFPAVVWGTGLSYPTLDADDRAALGAYLDAGGKLFLTGQDIGWELDDQGGAAYQWYENYLRATYVLDDTNDYTLDGVPGDPVSDGIDLVIQGGDGANNQEYPDAINPADGTGTVIWTYDGTRNGAIRVDTGTYKVVYLGFGFEAIDNPDDRRDVMQQSMAWLLLPPMPAGSVPDDQPLRLDTALANRRLVLSWGDSCLETDVDYEIYEGTFGDFYSHESMFCTTGGATQKTINMPLLDKYYLVVPASPNSEGSYGTNSEGVERPQGAGACLNQLIGECTR